MRSIGFAVAAIGMMGVSTAAWADAVVSPVSGSFLVSHGRGFVRESASVTLVVGDRVMVAQGSHATITYSDGCSVQILPGAVQIIKASSPCTTQGNQPGLGDPLTGTLGINLVGYGVAGGVVALGVISATISFGEKDAPPPPAMSP